MSEYMRCWCAMCKKELGELYSKTDRLSKDAYITMFCKECHGKL